MTKEDDAFLRRIEKRLSGAKKPTSPPKMRREGQKNMRIRAPSVVLPDSKKVKPRRKEHKKPVKDPSVMEVPTIKKASRIRRVRKLSRGERNIAWIEKYCRVPEGQFVGRPLVLAPFMKQDLLTIYDNPEKTRQAIISRGRKNAKTVEAAIITLLHLLGPEAILNSQMFSAAQSREQASILHDRASKMVRLSPELHSAAEIGDTGKWIRCPELGTLYRALSAEATTAFGLSPVLLIHDELGQVRAPTSTLYDALETATAAQSDPLSIIISTQAPIDGSLLSTLIDDLKKDPDPRKILLLDTAPEDMDPFTEEAIRMANPAFDYFMNKEEVLAMAADAKRIPSKEPAYRNLVLNQRVEATSPFISKSLWRSCSDPPKSLDDVDVYAGLDLADVNDLAAFVMAGKVDGVWQIHPTFWLPEVGLPEKSRNDRVPYDIWHRQGFLETSPGKSIDYSFIAAHIRRQFLKYRIKKIAFDRWNFRHLRPWLIFAGFSEQEIEELFVEFGHGYQSMSPALRVLEGEILNQRIAHGDHPVLSMCAANAVVVKDPANNRKLDKARSTGRIDGMVCLAMISGIAETETSTPPKRFQMFFVG